MKKLEIHIDSMVSNLDEKDRKFLVARIEGLSSVFPFNEYEYMLTFLIDRGIIKFNEYEKLRADYISANKYLNLYGLAPRIFGQIWGEAHLTDIEGRFIKPTKDIDSEYAGQYDLWLDGVRVEVKAARAINTKKRGDLVSKALRYESKEPFWMNYQQLKIDCCDVFIFIGVWVDIICYWVMSDAEVKNSKYISHQHRGGIEYQIGITEKNIRDFDVYRVLPAKIYESVLNKSRK